MAQFFVGRLSWQGRLQQLFQQLAMPLCLMLIGLPLASAAPSARRSPRSSRAPRSTAVRPGTPVPTAAATRLNAAAAGTGLPRPGVARPAAVTRASASAAAAAAAAVAAAAAAATGPRSYSQHALTKIRPGSLLQHDPAAQQPRMDLRGTWERLRDVEVARHFARLAELDVIAALDERTDEMGLAEMAEDVRRQELERHYRAMYQLRCRALGQVVAAAIP